MKLLFGTGNLAKLEAMRKRLKVLDIELVGLRDLGRKIPDIDEDGKTPLENARKKAFGYYEAFHMPVFSCDSGLYIDELPENMQPGVHVRTVNGKHLSDEEMIAYYSGLAKEYGNLTATYKNAVCLVMDLEHVYEAMEKSMEGGPFLITEKPCGRVRKKGFPLDSLSIDIKTGKYYYDLGEEEMNRLDVENGFLEFFRKVIKNNVGAVL